MNQYTADSQQIYTTSVTHKDHHATNTNLKHNQNQHYSIV